MTGASVVRQRPPEVIAGASLAEHLFCAPVNRKVFCEECGTPIFELRDIAGEPHLVVKARHHGQKHLSVVSLASLGAA